MRSTTKEVRNTHTPMIVNMNLLSCQQPVITKQIFGRLLATFLPLPVSSSPGPTLVGCERSLNPWLQVFCWFRAPAVGPRQRAWGLWGLLPNGQQITRSSLTGVCSKFSMTFFLVLQKWQVAWSPRPSTWGGCENPWSAVLETVGRMPGGWRRKFQPD